MANAPPVGARYGMKIDCWKLVKLVFNRKNKLGEKQL
jgi:hypothetical protein